MSLFSCLPGQLSFPAASCIFFSLVQIHLLLSTWHSSLSHIFLLCPMTSSCSALWLSWSSCLSSSKFFLCIHFPCKVHVKYDATCHYFPPNLSSTRRNKDAWQSQFFNIVMLIVIWYFIPWWFFICYFIQSLIYWESELGREEHVSCYCLWNCALAGSTLIISSVKPSFFKLGSLNSCYRNWLLKFKKLALSLL